MKRPAIYIGYEANPNSLHQSGEMTFITSDGEFLDSTDIKIRGYYELILPKLPTIEEAILIAKTIEADQMQQVYFFSRHTPDALMVEHLGGEITQQFHGTISNVRRIGDAIAFEETIGQETIAHQIPSNSIVVAVAPIALQLAWLQAGINKLLIPQTQREADGLSFNP